MGFDLVNILGKPCMVTVAHNEKGKAKVIGVSGLPKGVTCPETSACSWGASELLTSTSPIESRRRDRFMSKVNA